MLYQSNANFLSKSTSQIPEWEMHPMRYITMLRFAFLQFKASPGTSPAKQRIAIKGSRIGMHLFRCRSLVAWPNAPRVKFCKTLLGRPIQQECWKMFVRTQSFDRMSSATTVLHFFSEPEKDQIFLRQIALFVV